MTELVASTGTDRARDRIDLSAAPAEGGGCHGGKDTMLEAAKKAGKTEILDQYAADYPVGPHDQPQSMCPAFGSLRVGLRMRRTATVLSGSACCVYGLTFTSHFYGARRSVGYVPFSSETLVTGKLFEDIKEAVEQMADPEKYDTIVVTNLCVPTASGVPLRLLPDSINGVRIIGIDVLDRGEERPEVDTQRNQRVVIETGEADVLHEGTGQVGTVNPEPAVLDR